MEDLKKELQKYRSIYDSLDFYCYLNAFYDDGIRNLNFGSNDSKNTRTMDALIDYIPKVIDIQMEKPSHLRFCLTCIATRDLHSFRSYVKQKNLVNKIVKIS